MKNRGSFSLPSALHAKRIVIRCLLFFTPLRVIVAIPRSGTLYPRRPPSSALKRSRRRNFARISCCVARSSSTTFGSADAASPCRLSSFNPYLLCRLIRYLNNELKEIDNLLQKACCQPVSDNRSTSGTLNLSSKIFRFSLNSGPDTVRLLDMRSWTHFHNA